MYYRIVTTAENIDFERVASLLSYYGLSDLSASQQKLVFERSYAVVFIYDNELLIGFGRALSDGICQAAIYNIALDQNYHKKGLGKIIIEELIKQVSECNIILYTHPNTVSLYEHLGFKKMKTGMAMYQRSHLDQLREMKFI